MITKVIISLAFLAAVLYCTFKVNLMKKNNMKAMLTILLLGSFVLRLVMGYTTIGFEVDINCFKSWGNMINSIGYGEMYYSGVFLDYPPGYLYVLGWLDSVRQIFGLSFESSGYTLLIKMPSIISDIICGYLIYRIGKNKIGDGNSIVAAALYLFCPAVLINSTVWGQADSFTTILLLAAILLLVKDKFKFTVAAAIIYGLGVICKPQMLIFAPVFLFYTIRRKDFKGLIVGVFAALAVAMLVATPYVKNWDYWFIVEKYKETMDYYNYYTINAYNFWGLIGKNWGALPENPIGSFVLNWAGPVLATAICGFVMLKAKDKNVVFVCPSVLMATVYIFSVKMHERYLFPVLIFLILAYLLSKDKRFMLCFAGFSFFHYLNVAYVLYLNNSFIDPASVEIILFSLAHVLVYIYMIWTILDVYIFGRTRQIEFKAKPRNENKIASKISTTLSLSGAGWESEPHGKMRKKDFLFVGVITAVYAVVGFWGLGDNISANTSWTPNEGESVTIEVEGDYSSIIYLPGIGVQETGSYPRVGTNIKIETSQDGITWSDVGEITGGSVYSWTEQGVNEGGKYVRVSSIGPQTTINEIAFKSLRGDSFVNFSIVDGEGTKLIDEQGAVPLYPSYMNSTYFDEIYHARTAYEHTLGVEPYENTHPTLGKLIISVGINLFGMNPFGWRFMGALFGVLMLPIFYHLLRRLLNCSFIAAAGTVLFAFDFMHFTQTRIATIDTYAVFFLLLMYDAMLCFCQMDLRKSPVKKLIVPLALCGIFTGIGIASKWTAAYGAIGLAVMYFGKLISTYMRTQGEKEKKLVYKKAIDLCLWCMLFFVAVPFAIYFAAFLPLTLLPHNNYDVFGRFLSYQTHMFNYHSQLVATHYFASPWYEWPLDLRNIWYYSGSNINGNGGVNTIVCLGNPILWWSSLAATVYALIKVIKDRGAALVTALVGFAAVFLPWVLVPRLTFVYHYFTAVPFIIICLMYVLKKSRDIAFIGKRFGETGILRKLSIWHIGILAFVGINIVMFIVFYPAISGVSSTREYLDALEWLPNWYFI